MHSSHSKVDIIQSQQRPKSKKRNGSVRSGKGKTTANTMNTSIDNKTTQNFLHKTSQSSQKGVSVKSSKDTNSTNLNS